MEEKNAVFKKALFNFAGVYRMVEGFEESPLEDEKDGEEDICQLDPDVSCLVIYSSASRGSASPPLSESMSCPHRKSFALL